MPDKKIILPVAAAVAVVLCVGGFFFYKHYTSTPEYIVKQVIAAYEKKDFSEFEKYFDTDNFSRNVWTDYKDWLSQNFDVIWTPLRDNIDSADSLKVTFRNVISGKKTFQDLDSIEETSRRTVSIAQLLDKLHEPQISVLSESDSDKKVRINAKTYDEHEMNFEVVMKNYNGTWKITELSNVGEICTVFKNLSKESLVSYLKEVQPIQDKYNEMWESANANAPLGDMQYSLRSEREATLWKNFLTARKQAEDYRIAELSKINANPFSDILNSNRIECSKNFAKHWETLLQQFQKGMADRNFSSPEVRALEEEANKYTDLAKKADESVRYLIDRVNYVPAPTENTEKKVSQASKSPAPSGENWIKDEHDVYLWNPKPVDGETVSWNGAFIQDGDYKYADGFGVTTWKRYGEVTQVDEGTFEHGKRHGVFKHQFFPSGNVDHSTWEHGVQK